MSQKPLQIVDIPGHERVRQRCFDNFKNSCCGVIFVIDSLSFIQDIHDVAEYLFLYFCRVFYFPFVIIIVINAFFYRYLYTILLDPVIVSAKPPIMILCNKQDHALAKGSSVIKLLLEKEM